MVAEGVSSPCGLGQEAHADHSMLAIMVSVAAAPAGALASNRPPGTRPSTRATPVADADGPWLTVTIGDQQLPTVASGVGGRSGGPLCLESHLASGCDQRRWSPTCTRRRCQLAVRASKSPRIRHGADRNPPGGSRSCYEQRGDHPRSSVVVKVANWRSRTGDVPADAAPNQVVPVWMASRRVGARLPLVLRAAAPRTAPPWPCRDRPAHRIRAAGFAPALDACSSAPSARSPAAWPPGSSCRLQLTKRRGGKERRGGTTVHPVRPADPRVDRLT